MKRKNAKVQNKAYKFRAYPTDEQKTLFAKTVGCCRFIYNKILSDKKSYYGQTQEAIYPTPAQYKEEFPFLKEVDSLALANVQLDLDSAYKAFFRGQNQFSKFKSKHKSHRAYTTNCVNNNIKLSKNALTLPKMGELKIKQHRPIKANGKLKSVTFSQEADGNYYVSILFEFELLAKPKLIDHANAVGLDMSMKELFVSSDGEFANYPRFYRQSEEKLAQEQRKLSKMKENSQNYRKQKQKIAKLYAKTKHQRKDFLHKASRNLVNCYDIIRIESLNMKAMAQALHFGKSVHDNGWGIFVNQLSYKLFEEGKILVKIDKWFPSSKTCSVCGKKHTTLTLKDKIFICPHRGNIVDRDYQAAINIKNEGLRLLSKVS